MPANLVEGADGGKVVRAEDAGRPRLKRQQFTDRPGGLFGIQVNGRTTIPLGNLQPERTAALRESLDARPRDEGILPMHKGDSPVPPAVYVSQQLEHAGVVVRNHRAVVGCAGVDHYHGQHGVGQNKFRQFAGVVFQTQDQDPVIITVFAVIRVVAHDALSCDVDRRDVVALLLHYLLDAGGDP